MSASLGSKGKWSFYFTTLALLALALTAALINAQSAPAQNSPKPGNPKISWTPKSLAATVSAGASNTFNLSFVATDNLTNMALRVVPELQPFVQVSPATIQNINAGESVAVTVTVATPALTLPQTVAGTMQLRSTDGNDRTIANPLPVNLTVTWATFSNAQAGVQMSYPDFGIPSKVEVNRTSSGAIRLNVSFQSANSSNFVNGFGVFLKPNPNNLSLSDWFHQNVDPDGTLISSGVFTEAMLVDGRRALVISGPLPNDFGPAMSVYGISKSGNTIISMGQSEDNQLGVIGVRQSQIDRLLLEVLTNLQVP